MNKIFISALSIGLLGVLTSMIGIFTGIFLSSFVARRGKKFKGTTLGFIAGLMIAIVCFDLLPESFEIGTTYIGTIGILLGLVVSILIDNEIEHSHFYVLSNNNQKYLKAAFLMAIGIGIHNIPGGIALGSLFYNDSIKGLHLAFALLAHGIPEGLTLGIILRECKSTNAFILIIFSMITSLPMGLGSILGAFIGQLSPLIICLSLAFAGGMILYIIYNETLPSSKEIWRGKLSTIGNVLGMVVGILIVTFFAA